MIRMTQRVVADRQIVGLGKTYLSVRDAGSTITHVSSATRPRTVGIMLRVIGVRIERDNPQFSHWEGLTRGHQTKGKLSTNPRSSLRFHRHQKASQWAST